MKKFAIFGMLMKSPAGEPQYEQLNIIVTAPNARAAVDSAKKDMLATGVYRRFNLPHTKAVPV
jgi:hypothetical protein